MRNFILISYEGIEPGICTQREMVDLLRESGTVRDLEDINVECISEKEAVAIVAVICDGRAFPHSPTFTKEKEVNVAPEQKATIIILDRYKDIIATKNMTNLALQMLRDVANAKSRKNDEQLISAVTILAHVQPQDHFEFETIKDEKLWLKVLEIIRNIYSVVCQGQ